MFKKVLITIIALMCVTTVTIVLLVRSSPQRLSQIALYALSQLGVEHIEFASITPSWDTIELQAVALTYKTEELALNAQAKTVRLEYQLWPTFRWSLRTLELEDGQLELTPSKSSPESSHTFSVDIPHILSQLPVQELKLSHILIRSPVLASSITTDLYVTRSGQMTLAAQIEEAENKATIVFSSSNSAKDFEIKASWQKNSSPQIDCSLQGGFTSPQNLILKASTQCHLYPLVISDVSLPESTLQFTKPLTLELEEKKMRLSATRAEVTTSPFRLKEYPITLPPLRISLQSALVSAEKVTATGALQIQQGQIKIKDTILNQVDALIPIQYSGQLLMPAEGTLKISHVTSAIELQNIAARFQLKKKNQLTITSMSTDIFGGQASTNNILLTFPLRLWKVPLTLKGLQITKIVELYPQESVQASGILDGALTIEQQSDGIIIPDGSLQSVPPGGTINYLRPVDPDSPAALVYAFNALSNFRYSKIHASIDMNTAGDIHLGVSISGHNPDFQRGKPVELNLNIEENLYKLIESIRLAQGEGSQLENSIRQATK